MKGVVLSFIFSFFIASVRLELEISCETFAHLNLAKASNLTPLFFRPVRALLLPCSLAPRTAMESPWPEEEPAPRMRHTGSAGGAAAPNPGFSPTSHYGPADPDEMVVAGQYAVTMGHNEDPTHGARSYDEDGHDTPVYRGDAGPKMSVDALRRETRLANYLQEHATPIPEPTPVPAPFIVPPPMVPQLDAAPQPMRAPAPLPAPAPAPVTYSGGSCGCLNSYRATVIALILFGLALLFCFISFFGPWSYSNRVELGASGITTWRFSWKYDYFLSYYESKVSGQEFTYRTSSDWRSQCHSNGTWAAIVFNVFALVLLIPVFVLALLGYRKDNRKMVLASMIMAWICFVFFFFSLGFWLLGCNDTIRHYITSARSTDASAITNTVRLAWGWGLVLLAWFLTLAGAILQTIHFRVLSTGFSGASYLAKPVYGSAQPVAGATGATYYGPGLGDLQQQQALAAAAAANGTAYNGNVNGAPAIGYDPAPTAGFAAPPPQQRAGPMVGANGLPLPAAAVAQMQAQQQQQMYQQQQLQRMQGSPYAAAPGMQQQQQPAFGATPSRGLPPGAYASAQRQQQQTPSRNSFAGDGDANGGYDAAAALGYGAGIANTPRGSVSGFDTGAGAGYGGYGQESPHHVSYGRSGSGGAPVMFHGGSPSQSRMRSVNGDDDLERQYQMQQRQQQFQYGTGAAAGGQQGGVEMQQWRAAQY